MQSVNPNTQKFLIFLIDFQDSPAHPFTRAEFENYFLNGRFKNYMQEQSYGKFSYTADVADWIKIPENGPSTRVFTDSRYIDKFNLGRVYGINSQGVLVFDNSFAMNPIQQYIFDLLISKGVFL